MKRRNWAYIILVFMLVVLMGNQVYSTDYSSANIGTLLVVSGGTFHNGSSDMTVSSFRMSRYEITGDQFAKVMGGRDPSHFSSLTNNPVERVNWYATLVFCNKLSLLEGLTPVYSISGSTNPTDWGEIPRGNNPTWDQVTANWSANGYRLPTETEWQFAAQGGNNSQGYTYSGSNTIEDVAWYKINSGNTSHTVGQKVENELGFFDMSGNVLEWCWDWSGSYPSTAQTDYRGADSGASRVIRGGNWGDGATRCTVDSRGSRIPRYMSASIGFRVVRN